MIKVKDDIRSIKKTHSSQHLDNRIFLKHSTDELKKL